MPNDLKKLIIGLGTGRSGTVSLTVFLDSQKKSFFVHEGAYSQKSIFRYIAGNYLPWQIDLIRFEEWYKNLRLASSDTKYYGDVCISLIQYLPYILEKEPGAIFICIEREKKKVVDSLMHATKGINYWDNKDRFKKFDFWGEIFPCIDGSDKLDAIKKYWDLYHRTIVLLREKYPNSIHVFPIETLNSVSGRHEILDCVGYPSEGRVVEGDFRKNKKMAGLVIFLFRVFMTFRVIFFRIRPSYTSYSKNIKE